MSGPASGARTERVDLLVRAYGDDACAVAKRREASFRAAGYRRLAAEWAAIAASFDPGDDRAGADGGSAN